MQILAKQKVFMIGKYANIRKTKSFHDWGNMQIFAKQKVFMIGKYANIRKTKSFMIEKYANIRKTKSFMIGKYANIHKTKSFHDGEICKHFSWLGPELLVCCLALRGPTGVFLLLRS